MKKSSLLIIFLVVFLDLVGFGIVIPILPYYARQFGASAFELGWLMTIFSLMQFLFSPFWGRLSDHIGRRPVLLISITVTALSLIVLGFSHSLKWLFIGRLAAGIGSANISTAYAYITDITTEENRAKGMGLIGAGFGLGFIFGPAIGGLLSRYGYNMPMFAAAILGVFNLLFAFWKLKEPRLTTEIRSRNRNKRFDFEIVREVMEYPRTARAIILFGLMTLAVTQMEVIFGIYLLESFGYDAQSAGILLAVMGLIMAAIQGGFIGKLVKQFGESKLVINGGWIAALGLFFFALSPSMPFITLSLILMALGHGVMHPSLSTIASLDAPPQSRGSTMGVFQSASSLARVFGPPTAGLLYDHAGKSTPFYVSSILFVVVSMGAYQAWGRNPIRSK